MSIEEELEAYIARAQLAQGDDGRLAAIMTDMEHHYCIPTLASLLAPWKARTPYAEDILKAYQHISRQRLL